MQARNARHRSVDLNRLPAPLTVTTPAAATTVSTAAAHRHTPSPCSVCIPESPYSPSPPSSHHHIRFLFHPNVLKLAAIVRRKRGASLPREWKPCETEKKKKKKKKQQDDDSSASAQPPTAVDANGNAQMRSEEMEEKKYEFSSEASMSQKPHLSSVVVGDRLPSICAPLESKSNDEKLQKDDFGSSQSILHAMQQRDREVASTQRKHRSTQVTTSKLIYRGLAPYNSKSSTKQLEQEVRLVTLAKIQEKDDPQHPSYQITSYAVLADLLDLILHPFRKHVLTFDEVKARPYVRRISHHLIQLCDCDIDIVLSHSSTAPISIRAQLLPLSGLLELLQQVAVSESLHKHGEELTMFVKETVVNAMTIANLGLQPEPTSPIEGKRSRPKKNESKNSTRVSNAPSSLSVATVNTTAVASLTCNEDNESVYSNASGDCMVHCILAERDDLYLVHWCEENGSPCAADEEDATTWEICEQIESSATVAVSDFRADVRCSAFAKWKSLKEEQLVSKGRNKQNQRKPQRHIEW